MAVEVLLETQDLEKEFINPGILFFQKRKKVSAVHRVNLKIFSGETLGLVGESGCGKSTLGDMIAGLIRPSSGRVLYKGEDIFAFSGEKMNQFRHRIQMIFQDPYSSLNPRMTVGELVAAPLNIHKEGTRRVRLERVREALDLVGLGKESLSRYPHEFSGGQRQRIGIARAIILHPEFVVCDEPVSALDVSVRSQIINLMQDMQEKLGLTYLFISHDLSLIHHISRRVAVMYLGEIVEIDDKAELYRRPRHPYTRALLSAIPLPDRKVRRSPVMMVGSLPNIYDIPKGCRFNTRCPFIIEKCRTTTPSLTELDPGHFVSCHLESMQESVGEGISFAAPVLPPVPRPIPKSMVAPGEYQI
jgi:peptide/nickel transport system ATP-binding protein/oligopeptide transport system ATP-binding protein